MPDLAMRKGLLKKLLAKVKNNLSAKDFDTAAAATNGYSCSDLTALARDAALNPMRRLGSQLATIKETDIPEVTIRDIQESLSRVRKSVPPDAVSKMEEWNKNYGYQT